MKRLVLAASVAASVALFPALSWAQVPPPMPGPPPMPQPAPQYFYNDNGKPVGPLTLDQIIALVKAGKISPDTLVWKAGMPSWVAAKDLPDLRQPAPGPQPQPPRPQPQPVAGGPCGGKHTFVADDFTKNPVNDPAFSVEDGKLKVKAAPDAIRWYAYRTKISGNYDICVTAQIPHRFDEASVFAGIIFGASSTLEDFYALTINAAGGAAVFNVRKKEFERSIDWRDVKGMNTDPGSKNTMRVSVKGNTATFFINEQQFDTMSIQPPSGGGQVGLLFTSEQAQVDAWKFINFKATDLP